MTRLQYQATSAQPRPCLHCIQKFALEAAQEAGLVSEFATTMPPGTFVGVICTGEQDEDGRFKLRIDITIPSSEDTPADQHESNPHDVDRLSQLLEGVNLSAVNDGEGGGE